MNRFAWWNQYANVDPAYAIARARAARLDAVIVKAGYPRVRDALLNAGITVGTEIYAYPNTIERQAQQLRDDMAAGAAFIVLNCEHEWEPLDAAPMRALIAAIPPVPMYACTDTRGARWDMPYQRELRARAHGFMPMIYPKAFGQSAARAFSAALDGRDFLGRSVVPAIQTYDNIGAAAVTDQIAQCTARGLAGYGAYTIGHATDAEWSAIIAHAPTHTPTPTPRPTPRQLNTAATVFVDAALHALRGRQLPDSVLAAIRYLIS